MTLSRKSTPDGDQRFFIHANLINGQWVQARDRRVVEVSNPATGEVIGSVPSCGAVETRQAIEAASKAGPVWRSKTAAERAVALRKMASLLEEHREELAKTLTIEQGKPLAESRGEITASIAYIQWFSEEARRIYGDTIPSPWPDRRITVTKEAVGVVGAITPWNFPSSMIARKLGPALAAGCSIVIKPALETPFSGLAWGMIAEEAGIPPGVVNIVTGEAETIGDELTSNPCVRKISFTGSTRVGKLLAQQSAGTMKRLSLELGGNAPFIVFEDADIDAAVKGGIQAKFRNSGQTCVCANRFLIHESIYEQFSAKFASATAALRSGNGLNPGVDQGPLISDRSMTRMREYVDDAVRNGAHVMCGGKVLERDGFFFEPTVLTDVRLNMKVTRDEIFGPIAPLLKFKSEEEAIEIANDTNSGLAAFFYTRDLSRSFRVSERLQYGQVGLNAGVITSEVTPFGGFKESGIGREGSKYGCDEYVQIKYFCAGGLENMH